HALAGREFPPAVREALRYVAPAVMAALVISLGFDGSTEVGWAEVAALVVGGVVGWRTRSLPSVLVAGMVTLWLVRAAACEKYLQLWKVLRIVSTMATIQGGAMDDLKRTLEQVERDRLETYVGDSRYRIPWWYTLGFAVAGAGALMTLGIETKWLGVAIALAVAMVIGA